MTGSRRGLGCTMAQWSGGFYLAVLVKLAALTENARSKHNKSYAGPCSTSQGDRW
jgi:hypothetical protein